MLIERVEFLEDYIIEIIFRGNYKYFYDFKQQLNTIRFRKIKSFRDFSKGKLVDDCRIVWDEETSLDDYEIFGFEFYESGLYIHPKNKYSFCPIEA